MCRAFVLEAHTRCRQIVIVGGFSSGSIMAAQSGANYILQAAIHVVILSSVAKRYHGRAVDTARQVRGQCDNDGVDGGAANSICGTIERSVDRWIDEAPSGFPPFSLCAESSL